MHFRLGFFLLNGPINCSGSGLVIGPLAGLVKWLVQMERACFSLSHWRAALSPQGCCAMTSADQARAEETLANDTVPDRAGQTLASEEGADEELASAGGSSSAADQEGAEKTLARADELFAKGSKAIEDGDFVDAVDSLSRALEIRLGLRSVGLV